MKKLIGLFVAAMMLFSVMTANAKVTYEEKDGKWTCIITYKNIFRTLLLNIRCHF